MNGKKQVEFRYYDIPQGDIVLPLTGEGWNKEYGEGRDKLHFHNYFEVGHCYAGEGEMILGALFIYSLKTLPAQLAGVCSAMETVYGILFALLLLGEVPSVREILGAVIIIGTVLIAQTRTE